MNGDQALGAIATMGALVLVGSAVIARHRRGEPVARSVAIWLAVFAAALAAGLWMDGRL